MTSCSKVYLDGLSNDRGRYLEIAKQWGLSLVCAYVASMLFRTAITITGATATAATILSDAMSDHFYSIWCENWSERSGEVEFLRWQPMIFDESPEGLFAMRMDSGDLVGMEENIAVAVIFGGDAAGEVIGDIRVEKAVKVDMQIAVAVGGFDRGDCFHGQLLLIMVGMVI